MVFMCDSKRWKLELEPFDYIVNGEHKNVIKFCIHPNSKHIIALMTHTTNYDIRYGGTFQKPIKSCEDCIELDMDNFLEPTAADHTIILDMFSDLQLNSLEQDELAKDVFEEARKQVSKDAEKLCNKSLRIVIKMVVSTGIFLKTEDRDWVIEFYVESLKRVRGRLIKHEEEEEKEVCAICLEEYLEGSTVIRLQCKHEFHENCFMNCVKNHIHRCPLCRFDPLWFLSTFR